MAMGVGTPGDRHTPRPRLLIQSGRIMQKPADNLVRVSPECEIPNMPGFLVFVLLKFLRCASRRQFVCKLRFRMWRKARRRILGRTLYQRPVEKAVKNHQPIKTYYYENQRAFPRVCIVPVFQKSGFRLSQAYSPFAFVFHKLTRQ